MQSKSVFSSVTSLIPFVNTTDGNRVQMASSMIRQSQLLERGEPPLIVPEHAFLKGSALSYQRAPKPGIVVDKYQNVMLVQYDDGEEDVFLLNDMLTTSFNIGQRFNAHDILVHHKGFDPILELPRTGLNANVMFGTESSKTYEDAVVLTESGSEAFKYIYPVKLVYEFYNNILISIEKNLKPGIELKQGDVILIKKKYTSSLNSLVTPETIKEYSPYSFMITQISAFYKDEFLKYQPEPTRKLFQYFGKSETNLHPLIKKALKKSFSFDGDAYLVIEGLMVAKPGKGDKFANPYGNKGVVSAIIPDFHLYDDMNQIKFTPHIVHTPVGVPSRMNPGQILHMALGYILKHVVPKRLKQLQTLDEKVKFLLNVYRYIEPSRIKQLVEALKVYDRENLKKQIKYIERHGFRIIVSQFSYNMFDKVYKLYKELGVPTSFIDERTGLRMGAGVIYSFPLEHLAFKKIKHISTGPVDSRTLQPADGQRMGEMEMWTLASHNALNFLKESLTVRSDDVRNKGRVIGELIRNGKSSIKDKRTYSPTFDLFKSYIGLMGIEIVDKDKLK